LCRICCRLDLVEQSEPNSDMDLLELSKRTRGVVARAETAVEHEMYGNQAIVSFVNII
jgi:hypothetical protein